MVRTGPAAGGARASSAEPHTRETAAIAMSVGAAGIHGLVTVECHGGPAVVIGSRRHRA